jgi:RNA polymerase sigma-70 factor (ECF subfamily)
MMSFVLQMLHNSKWNYGNRPIKLIMAHGVCFAGRRQRRGSLTLKTPQANVVDISEADDALAEEKRIAAGIVAGIRNGDSDAESSLVTRYGQGMQYLLSRKVGDAERARDLVQETFCIAIEKLRKTPLEQPERLAGYLRGIAVRVAMNDGRRKQREPISVDIAAVAAIPDATPRQFEMLDVEQRASAIRELMRTMPMERDRELLMRYYIYDRNKQEICAELGLDSLHFNRVLHRAKSRFRKIVEDSGNFGRPGKS